MRALREDVQSFPDHAEREGDEGYYCRGYQTLRSAICANKDILLRKEFLGRKEKMGLERERLLREREEGRRKAQGPAAEERLREWLAAERLDQRMAECFVEAVRVFEGRRLEASLLGREEILRKMEG